ncbi:MAG: hemerythrin family protein [Magnetococcales bacterium]|nr:hemerythrin family protein [Magnetococcales bacterium]
MPVGNARWSEDLSVGIASIDADHKKLFVLLNDLFAACFAGVGDEVVSDTLHVLSDYTQYHFTREESLLQELGSPDLAQQIEKHRFLIEQLDKIARQGPAATSEDLLLFLEEWLVRHIAETDKASFAPYK